MAAHVWAVAVQGVQEADGKHLGHAFRHLVGREPRDRRRLVGRPLRAAGWLAAEDQGHDASGRVLVDPRQLVHLDLDACLLQDLAGHARFGGLFEFEYAAGELPSAVVGTADRQEAPVLAHHGSGHGYRVQRWCLPCLL